jgi:SnoaL-like protein
MRRWRRLGREANAPAADGLRAPVIRAWSRALNREDYKRAASYFAPGAIVQQAEVFSLPDRDAALAFNRSLPCKADITDIKDKGATTLAAFKLRAGAGGSGASCSGVARVRFRLRGGRFVEWRQLPEPPRPEGKTA